MFERFFAAEKNKNPEPSNTWLWTGNYAAWSNDFICFGSSFSELRKYVEY